MSLADLHVHGAPPPSLGAALFVIATEMHERFAEVASFKENISLKSCILCSLTVRDFMIRIGFKDAEVRPCCFVIRADTLDGKEQLHSLAIGQPDFKMGKDRSKGGWWGHMVCVLPAAGWLIDTTLFQAKRVYWKELPGMFAAPLDPGERPVSVQDIDHHSLAAFRAVSGAGHVLRLQWLDQPENRYWKNGPDTAPYRRRPIVNQMVETYESLQKRRT